MLVAILLAGSEVGRHIAVVEAWVANLGSRGIFAFVGLFVLAASLLVPDTLLSIAAGALFGVWWGMAAVLAGSLVAAAMQFGLARHLLRSRIQTALATRPALRAIQGAVLRDELRLQLWLRLTPLNPATVSYLLGAAGVRFATFIAACLAITPHLLIEVYFGHAGKHIAGMASGATRASRLHDAAIVGGLVVAIIAMIVLARTARLAFVQAVAETSPVNQPTTPE